MITPTAPQQHGAAFSSFPAVRAAHGQLITWHRDVGNTPELLARVAEFIQQGSATGAVLDADADRWATQSLLDYWANILDRAGYEAPDSMLAEFDPALAPELPDEPCPYIGLEAFREMHHHLFFGRKRLIDDLLKKSVTHRLIAVVGPSGSGKSSVIQGGVLSALKEGALPESRQWRYLPPIVPGSEPLVNLAHSLRPTHAGAEWVQEHVGKLLSCPSHLLELLDLMGDTPAIVVVDQFEEVFTLCDDNAVRQAFIDNLVTVARMAQTPHTVILTMRSDFETFVARVPSLQPLIEAGHVAMLPLNAGELREAIEKPAALVGLKFEAGVVDALVHDIVGEPAALPLLQFTLLTLWEHRERNRVTMESYRRLGGGRLALARSADAFYIQLIPEEQITARRILLRMVRPGEGLEVTSSRIRREALYRANDPDERVSRVLEKLIRAHLVRLTRGETVADDQVEVAHEALVRNWPTLVGWLDEERIAITRRRQLEARATEWVRLGRGSAGLLDEVELLEAEHWLRSPQAVAMGYSDALPAFVEASRTLIEAAKREQEAAHQRALAQAQALAEARRQQAEAEHQRAEAEHRAAHRLRRLTRMLVVALLVAMITSVAAFLGQQTATRNAHTAGAAFLASTLLDKQFDLAVLLGVEAYRRDQSLAARGSLLTSLSADPSLMHYLRGHTEGVNSVAFSPDATTIASGGADGTILLWDAANGASTGTPLIGHTQSVSSVVFSPNGSLLASGSADWTIVLWDVAGRKAIARPLTGHTDRITQLAFSPDGTLLASSSVDGTVLVWDVRTHRLLREPLRGHSGEVWSVAFRPDGTMLATGGRDNQVLLWDLQIGHMVAKLNHDRWVRSVAFSPDGGTLVSGGGEGSLILWDVVQQKQIGKIAAPQSSTIFSVAFNPDGRTLATGSTDGMVMLWDSAIARLGATASSPLIRSYHGHTAQISSVAFSSDGATLISGSADSTIIMRDLGGRQGLGQEIERFGAKVWSVAFSPDGEQLLVGSDEKTRPVTLWDLRAQQATPLMNVHQSGARTVAVSPDGKLLASGDFDNHVVLWNADNPQLYTLLDGHTNDITSVAFSPDSALLASASRDGTIRFWDTARRQLIGQAAPSGAGVVWNVAFSPDGTTLAAGDNRGVITLWDVATCLQDASSGECTPRSDGLIGHTALISSLAFSPDGKLLASGSNDGTVRLWDVEQQQPSGERLSSNGGSVRSVAFSPDGLTLASGSADGTITLWDVQAHQQSGTLRNFTYGIETVAFSPDGNWLASGDDHHRLVLWELSFDGLRRYACALVGRNVTRNEWQRYFSDEPYQATCPDISGVQAIDREQAIGALARSRQPELHEAPGTPSANDQASQPLPDTDLAVERTRFEALALIHRIRVIDIHNPQLADAIAGAREALAQAQALDADIDIDLNAEGRYIDMLQEIAKSRQLAIAGDITGAITAFNAARQINPALHTFPRFAERICYFGSLHQRAADVIDYCERAVALDESYRYERGIARALLGQTKEAIADFEWFAAYSQEKGQWEDKKLAEQYIDMLKRGENPFTDQKLADLLSQWR